MEDRRKYKREAVSPHLRVVLPDSDRSFGAFITNISSGGVEIFADYRIEPGQEVQLFICFESDPKAGKEEVVAGIVRWVQLTGSRFLLGVAFKDINSEDHPVLAGFLDFVST